MTSRSEWNQSQKVEELMMVLEIEVSKRYTPGEYDRIAAMPKEPVFKDTKLD